MSDGELTVVDNSTTPQSIDLIKNESMIKAENTQALAVVNEVLNNKPNPVMVNGKRHLEYEDWIALGNAFGLDVMTGDAEPVEVFEAKGFKAKAKLIRISDGTIIGGAEAYCLDNEQNWLNRDYFQMASMAQTRAGSKTLSNALRGIVALHKSLSGTPAEEMMEDTSAQKPNKPEAPSKSPAPKPKTAGKTSNLGNKPKAPSIDDEAIEVNATEIVTEDLSGDKPSMSFKDMCDNNKFLNMAVKELQANEVIVNHASIKNKLLDLLDMGKITESEYNEAKELLE
ncbi:hypothetical protein [Methanobrevibacter sp. V14]|uniref:hypothetical protein n=1 Tax=Methanobrevibacter sp. V14 TaxID=3064280 RepID=UPI002733B898|nr:hypothetical protein [Methanobrevibacter sp. V14]